MCKKRGGEAASGERKTAASTFGSRLARRPCTS